MLLLSLSRARASCRSEMILKLKRTPGIYLVGFMGCGKSTVGRALWPMNSAGSSPIWTRKSSERGHRPSAKFSTPRARQCSARSKPPRCAKRVRSVQCGRPQVISLGGGAFLSDENFEMVSNNGVTVWLDCALRLIERRVAAEIAPPAGARSRKTARAVRRAPPRSMTRADYPHRSAATTITRPR